ncbi:MAG: 50S ribosomal protein L18 [Nitrospirae bacterium]|nr:50S ribosomal protein L18 [Nitrospirota bacterium]MBI5694906.1 50S ribosomal protein L18 [Nitrospirota bacterium]
MGYTAKLTGRARRQNRIRKKVSGSTARPRLNVFRSASHIYAQIIDDTKGITLAAASTLDESVKEGLKHGGNIAAAKKVGAEVAKRALEKGVKDVVFDRGGYIFHGRIKALADSAREAGLNF